MTYNVFSGTLNPAQSQSPIPQFSVHVYCGQTAGWIKMALGMKVSLSLGHIVLDGDIAPPKKGAQPPMSIVAKQLDGSRCHLVRRFISAEATLC